MADSPPPGPSADWNLLFGILALQMNFLSRDALLQGLNGWTRHKDRPLSQLLVEQGALSSGYSFPGPASR